MRRTNCLADLAVSFLTWDRRDGQNKEGCAVSLVSPGDFFADVQCPLCGNVISVPVDREPLKISLSNREEWDHEPSVPLSIMCEPACGRRGCGAELRLKERHTDGDTSFLVYVEYAIPKISLGVVGDAHPDCVRVTVSGSNATL